MDRFPGHHHVGDGEFVRRLKGILADESATQRRIDADRLLMKALSKPVIDTQALRKALEAGACPDRPVAGLPPLNIAVRQKSFSAYFTLVTYGASFSDRDAEGNTSLGEVAKKGVRGIRKFLTGEEACFQEQDVTDTGTYQRRIDIVLEDILRDGDVRQVKAVLDLGAKPETGLDAAILSMDTAKIETLLNAGARAEMLDADLLWRMQKDKFYTKEWHALADYLALKGCAVTGVAKPEDMNLHDLRRVVPAGKKGATVMHVLADAGKFDVVLDYLKKNPEQRLTSEDFLATGGPYDFALVTVLARDKKLADVFTTGIWQGRVEEMAAVWDHVDKFYGAREQVDITKVKKAVADFRREKLGQMARKKNYKIGKG